MDCLKCYERVDRAIGHIFEQYGGCVARNPWVFILLSIVANTFSGLGVSHLEIEDNIELLYTPSDSQASKDRTTVQKLFGDKSASNFYPQSQSGPGIYGDIIFQSMEENILSLSYISEMKIAYDAIIQLTHKDSNGLDLSYKDVCARRNSSCVVTGDIMFASTFRQHLLNNNISYPTFEYQSIKEIFGNTKVENNILVSASFVKLRFYLRDDANTKDNTKIWMTKFLEKVRKLKTNNTNIYYAHSNSLSDEISSNLDDDIVLFALTFIFMILYASLATANWKCISDKQNLARAGVLATLISILGSIGFVSSCNVKFVSIVGVMPFLVLGIGLDDMFVLLSGLAETYEHDFKLTPEERIKKVMKSSGIGITITTLTNIIAFYVGASSSFLSVKNFCIYTGVAVMFCYLNYLTFFTACMSLHEQRIQDEKHCCTHRKLKHVDKGSNLKTRLCAGSKPKSREDIEGPMEKYPQKAIAEVLKRKPAKVVTIALFIGYIGISVWGTTGFQQGLDLNLLVNENSYLYQYNQVNTLYFTKNIPISFVLKNNVLYSEKKTMTLIDKMQADIEKDFAIDHLKTRNWLADFRKSPFYDNFSEVSFITALQKRFLPLFPFYKNDILFNDKNTSIKASRFFFFTSDIIDTNAQHDLMPRMRKIAKIAPLQETFAYSPAFIFFEQYQTVFPETLRSLGMSLVSIFVVTLIFLPHPVLVFLITVTLFMILVGLFGFMYFWDLSLNFLTMIYIIMSVGFCVDYSAHICHGFMDTRSSNRQTGTLGAVKKAGAPVFNGALSSFIGIIMLVFSKSYIFLSFFKIMMLIILFGMVHSLFFLPTLLSLFGPQFKDDDNSTQLSSAELSIICKNQVIPYDRNGKPKFIFQILNSRQYIHTKTVSPKSLRSRRMSL